MKKLICLLITVLMSLSVAGAEETPVYLALGDSISAGYGLTDKEARYTEIVAQHAGYMLINRAVNGNTAVGILEQLKDPAVAADVARADVITITCGGNDLLAALLDSIAAIYNASVPSETPLTTWDVLYILNDSSSPRQRALLLATLIALEGNPDMGITPFPQSAELAQSLADYRQNLTTLLSLLRQINPDARVILATQYSPYRHFSGLYITLNTAMDAGAQLLNAVILECAAALNCETADVYTAFCGREAELMNASMNPLILDFHPNAAGHEVIAQCVLDVLQGGE